MPTIRLGSRGSRLALVQADWVRQRLAAAWPDAEFEVVVIATTGDRAADRPLSTLGEKGVFVKELEAALLAGRIDLAVHSLKDCPTDLAGGLVLGAVPGPRQDAREALVAPRHGRLESLPAGAVVGTGSPRRRGQLLHLRPDLTVAEARGNLETRLRRLEEGRYDALILAAAGLNRLGLAERISQVFELRKMLPAPGQGALALECRVDDAQTMKLAAAISDERLAACVAAERKLLQLLGGGCHTALGVFCTHRQEGYAMQAVLAHPAGSHLIRAALAGVPMADELAEGVGALLYQKGAKELL